MNPKMNALVKMVWYLRTQNRKHLDLERLERLHPSSTFSVSTREACRVALSGTCDPPTSPSWSGVPVGADIQPAVPDAAS